MKQSKNNFDDKVKIRVGNQKIVLLYEKNVFVCRCDFTNRDIPKKAGFKWSSERKVWFTTTHSIAARLSDYATPSAKDEINRKAIVLKPYDGPLLTPKDKKLKDYQAETVRFALSRSKSYLALDPGLGKTAIACTILNILNVEKKTLMFYVCPPFLLNTVEAEFKAWTTIENFEVKRINRVFESMVGIKDTHLMLVPDSIIHRDDVIDTIKSVKREHDKKGRSTLVVDEAHRFKSLSAKRTKAVFKHTNPIFEKSVYMSGTPMPNRPIELYPVLSHVAPETIDYMTYPSFGIKYCAGFQGEWGWDFSGASNVPELAKRVIGSFMIRFRKSEVLKELPPKTESMVLIGENLPARLASIDREILKSFSPEDIMKFEVGKSLDINGDEIHIATYRRELGLAKVEESLKFINSILEDTDEAVLVFAHHSQVIRELDIGLSKYNPLVITGDTPVNKRAGIVAEFQNDKSRRVFIGNIQAAGVGFTLTKASRVVFVEFSWVPGENDQASDRAHRIGQRDNVLVQFLIYKNSIDRQVLESILKKKASIKHV